MSEDGSPHPASHSHFKKGKKGKERGRANDHETVDNPLSKGFS